MAGEAIRGAEQGGSKLIVFPARAGVVWERSRIIVFKKIVTHLEKLKVGAFSIIENHRSLGSHKVFLCVYLYLAGAVSLCFPI